jgi:hypothetical protein
MRISNFFDNLNTKHDKSGLSELVKQFASRFQEFGSKVSVICERQCPFLTAVLPSQGAALRPKLHPLLLRRNTARRTKERNM